MLSNKPYCLTLKLYKVLYRSAKKCAHDLNVDTIRVSIHIFRMLTVSPFFPTIPPRAPHLRTEMRSQCVLHCGLSIQTQILLPKLNNHRTPQRDAGGSIITAIRKPWQKYFALSKLRNCTQIIEYIYCTSTVNIFFHVTSFVIGIRIRSI